MDWRPILVLALLFAQSASAATTSAYQDSFESLWETDLGGDILTVSATDLTGDGSAEVVANTLFQSSVGKSGTIFALDSTGKQKWKYFAGLLDNSYTADSGHTIVAAGPYAEFVDPAGQALWKRSTRSSQLHPIYSQTAYASDVDGDGKVDALVGTNLGRKGTFIHVWTHEGDQILKSSFTSYLAPESIYAADLTGDGKQEIIVGTLKYAPNTVMGSYQAAYTKPATVTVFDPEGGEKWVDTHGGAVTAVTACDLEGDDFMEVIVGSLNRVAVYTSTGQVLWDVDVSGQVYGLSCADVDGEGPKEVIVGAGRTYALKNGGEQLWSYNSGNVRSIYVADFGGDGSPEIVTGSNSLRIISSDGSLLYKSDSYGDIYSIDVGDVTGDGYANIVFGSDDGVVRVIDTRKYSEEISADHFYMLAEKAYTLKDYNATIYNAQRAREVYSSLGKEMDVVKAQGFEDKATSYYEGDRYYNISLDYFKKGMYDEAREYASQALEEYRKVQDLRKINEASELEKEAQLIPNAERNINLSIEYLNQNLYSNASDYALKARSAYSFLGNETMQEQADAIYQLANTYVQYFTEVDLAYQEYGEGDYENATTHLKTAWGHYTTINDSSVLPQYENVSAMVGAVERDEKVIVYGGVGVILLVLALLAAALVLMVMFFNQKGGFASIADALEGSGLWFTEFGMWVRKSLGGGRRTNTRYEKSRSGLRGLRGGKGGSIGDGLRRI